MKKYDIAIIGGGPAGYTAAERAATGGLSTVLFEKESIGGVCLNQGCIPTKTLLYSAKVLDNIKNSSKYGVISADPTFDQGKIISRKNKVVRKLSAGVRMKLANHKVDIIQGLACMVGEKDHEIIIESNDEKYLVGKVVLCTGSETIIPQIKGLSEIEYWTSKEALDVKELPDSIAIIGGGVIGIEFASFFNSLGVRVSVIEMMPEILGVMDNECSEMLRSEYSKKRINFYLDTNVIEVSPSSVIVKQGDNQFAIEADKVLVSVGRKPIVDNLGLDVLSVDMRGNGVKTNEYMQTSNSNIYACGDITGHSLLAHTAVREAEVAINHILGVDDIMSYKAIPSVVYTNPEIAGVGKTEDEVRKENINYKVCKLPMSFSGRFVAENEMGNGLCKIIVDEHNHIIGCHMIGNIVSEVIVVAGMAIEKKFTLEEFKKIVFPHPTVSEIIHETLFV